MARFCPSCSGAIDIGESFETWNQPDTHEWGERRIVTAECGCCFAYGDTTEEALTLLSEYQAERGELCESERWYCRRATVPLVECASVHAALTLVPGAMREVA